MKLPIFTRFDRDHPLAAPPAALRDQPQRRRASRSGRIVGELEITGWRVDEDIHHRHHDTQSAMR